MPMKDDSAVKVMSYLGLDFNPAISSTKSFARAIELLNKQLFEMKANAITGAKEINRAFASQLSAGGMGSKVIWDQYGNPLKMVQKEAANTANSVKSMVNTINKESKRIKPPKSPKDSYNVLGSEFSRRAGWFLTGTAFYGGIAAGKEIVSTISEVEMGMIEISRIMEDSTYVMRDFRDELQMLGVDYGQTFETIQDIAVKWAQAGYDAADTLELTETALLALNTAELDATYATQGLIAIMAQWNLTSQELLPVLDKINKTADDFSITSKDIIDGLNRSGAAAKNANMTLEQTISNITVLREASGRTGKEVGNALNTIISYMQRTKSIDLMEKLGIRVFADEAKTQFVNINDLFQQLAVRWNDPSVSEGLKKQFEEAANDAGIFNEELAVAVGLQDEYNDLQKRDLAQSAAGIRRRNYFISLMERFNRTQEVLNNMLDAEGYSMRENLRTMEGLEKKWNSLKASAEAFAVAAVGDAGLLDALKGLVDGGTGAINAFNSLDESTKSLIINLGLLLGAMKGLQAAGKMFGIGGISAALPGWTKLIPVVLSAAGALILAGRNAKKAADEQVIASGKVAREYLALKDKLEKAKENTEEYTSAQDELYKSMDKLIQLNPELVSEFDDNARVISVHEEAVKKLAGTYDALIEAQGEQVVSLTEMTDEQKKLDRERLESTINTLQSQLNAYEKTLEYFRDQAPGYIKEERVPQTGTQKVMDFLDDVFGIGALSNILKIEETELRSKLGNWRKDLWGKIFGDDLAEGWSEIDKQAEENLLGPTNVENAARKVNEIRNDLQGILDEFNEKYGNLTAADGESPGADGATGIIPDGLPKDISALRKLLNANKISLSTYYNRLLEIRREEYSAYVSKSAKELGAMIKDENVQDYLSLEQEIIRAWEEISKSGDSFDTALKSIQRSFDKGTITAAEYISRLKKLGETYKLTEEDQWKVSDLLDEINEKLTDAPFEQASKSLKHWSRMGLYTAQQEFEKLKDLSSFKKLSAEEQWELDEELAGKYKDILKEQQDDIEEAYKERIKRIEEESKTAVNAKKEEIAEIEALKTSKARTEDEEDYNKRIAELRKERRYHEVRTGEEHRKAIIEIDEKIAEEKQEWQRKQDDWVLEDKKSTLEKEIDEIKVKAEEQKREWEAAYKKMQDDFSEHNINLLSIAATYDDSYYEDGLKKGKMWLEGFKSGSADSLINMDPEGGIGGLASKAKKNIIHDYGMNDTDYKKFIENGNEWWRLYNAGNRPSTNATMQALNEENNRLRTKYSIPPGKYPQFHTGGKSLSYGMAEIIPGEIFFQGNLAAKMESLLDLLRGWPAAPTPNQGRSIVINELMHIERVNYEDETDIELHARELNRVISTVKS